MYLGDFTPGKTVTGKFNTHKADGTPITLAGTPALSVYKDSTTESTSGVTLSVDYDSRTGLHRFSIDTSADGTFYAAGNNFEIVITTGTVDSVSVVGTVVGGFSLSNRSALRPTAADRTLDVSAGGEAGLDWANVGSPTTAVALTGTTIATTQKVDVETIKTRAVSAAGAIVVGGFVGQDTAAIGVNASGHVSRVVLADTVTTLTNLPAITAGWLTAAGIAADAITAAKIADGAIDTATFAAGTTIPRCTLVDTTTTNTDMLTAAGVWAAGTRTLTAGTNIVLAKGTGVTGFNDLSAAQVNAECDTALADVGVTTTITDRIDAAVSTRLASASYTAPPSAAAVAAAVRDVDNTTPAANSLGAAVNASASGGLDPQDVADLVVAGIGTVDANVVSLAAGAITDAAITAPAEAAGRPTGILAMIRRVFEWKENKRTRNRTTGAVALRNAADGGDLATQTQTSTGVTDTITKAQ